VGAEPAARGAIRAARAWAAGVLLFVGGLGAAYYHADQYHAGTPPGVTGHPPLTPDRAFHDLAFFARLAAAVGGFRLLDRLVPEAEPPDGPAR
jgi:hypothetical protein